MSDIESVPNAIGVAAGVKEVLEQEESTIAAIKSDISDAVGHMQATARYFEGFAGLLVKNGMPAAKQSEAGRDAVDIASRLAEATTKLEEMGTFIVGIIADVDQFSELMQSIIDDAQ